YASRVMPSSGQSGGSCGSARCTRGMSPQGAAFASVWDSETLRAPGETWFPKVFPKAVSELSLQEAQLTQAAPKEAASTERPFSSDSEGVAVGDSDAGRGPETCAMVDAVATRGYVAKTLALAPAGDLSVLHPRIAAVGRQ